MREEDIGAIGPHITDASANIAQSGHGGTQSRLDVDATGQQDDGADKKDEEIDEDEGGVLVDAADGDGLVVDFHGQHGIGVDDTPQVEHRVFDE